MTTSAHHHAGVSRAQQAAAVVAILALVLALVVVVAGAVGEVWRLLFGAGFLAMSVLGGWFALSRRGMPRLVGAGAVVAGLVLFLLVVADVWRVWALLLAVALAAVSVAAAGRALRPESPSAGAAAPAAPTAPVPRHPVLIMNLKSGGGKAERFELERRCRDRGIEPIVLTPGSDLLQLAEDAIDRGADVIGMAGGDGSQALVATVASRRGVPHVVIPAGTRNHFALDLGLDRDDVVGALDAYEDGVDHVIDLAEVNGRVFVNNASMGLYAEVVQSEEYRDAKVQTAAAMLPDLLGPDAVPLDLRFTVPSGEEASTAQLILVSNNPYDLHHLRGGGTRERMDGGVLGIATVQVGSAADAERLVALEAVGQLSRFAGWHEWTAAQFEVRSAGPVEIGVDGEALRLDPPLRFSIRPGALVVRLPRAALAASPTGRTVRVAERSTISALVAMAFGRAPGDR